VAGAAYSAGRQAEKGKALLAKAVIITNKDKKGKKRLNLHSKNTQKN
jgi:hypothetical protein